MEPHICNVLRLMFTIDILDWSKHCLFSVFGIQGLYLSHHVFIIIFHIFLLNIGLFSVYIRTKQFLRTIKYIWLQMSLILECNSDAKMGQRLWNPVCLCKYTVYSFALLILSTSVYNAFFFLLFMLVRFFFPSSVISHFFSCITVH